MSVCIEDVSEVKHATWNPDDRCNVDVSLLRSQRRRLNFEASFE